MPSDASGNYSLPAGYLAVAGDTIQPSQHNPPLEDLGGGMTARLMRSGVAPMTGPLKGADGSAAAPSFTFNSAQTTGWYLTSGGNIGFSITGTEVVEIGAAGLVKGGRFVGEIFEWTGTAAPALCVLPFGQTLSRTTYAALWAFAQIEIAAGNTLYNNGDGSTTFGIPDRRGRLGACWDSAGGTAANRLTTAGSSVNGAVLGSVGGLETQTLTLAQLPAGITSPFSGAGTSQGVVLVSPVTGFGITSYSANAGAQVWQAFQPGAVFSQVSLSVSGTATSNNTGGAAHPNVQPTLVTNSALFAGA